MADLIGGDRPLRVCDLCGAVDDHPRHVIAGSADGAFVPSEAALARVLADAPDDQRAKLVRELMDTTSSDRHLQCCADAGCPAEPADRCDQRLIGAEGLTGADLLDHLIKLQES